MLSCFLVRNSISIWIHIAKHFYIKLACNTLLNQHVTFISMKPTSIQSVKSIS